MFSHQPLRRWGASLLAAACLSLPLFASPDEQASHFPSTTQLFIAGRALPKPEVMADLVERFQLNPAVDYLLSQIPPVLPVSVTKDLLPIFEGQIAVGWVRTEERSVLDRMARRDRQIASWYQLQRQVGFLGQDVEKFHKKHKRLPKDWEEMVKLKARKSVPKTDDGQFVIEKTAKGWVVTVKYGGDLNLGDVADAPRYESGTGLVETKLKPTPPVNLLLAFKCADEALARKTFGRLVDEKNLETDATGNWILKLDDQTSPFLIQLDKGWLLFSDNSALLERYKAANPTDSLTGNPRYQFERAQLKGSSGEADIFGFADLQDFLSTTDYFGELPASAKMLKSAGVVFTSTPSKAPALPSAVESEMFVEADLGPAPAPAPAAPATAANATAPGNATATDAPANVTAPAPTTIVAPATDLSFLDKVPAQANTVYAFNVAETNAILNRIGQADPVFLDLVDGLWNKLMGELTRADAAKGTGWFVVETEIMDQFISGFRSVMTGRGSEWNDLPAEFTLEVPDAAVRDKLAAVLWDKLGDKGEPRTAGSGRYWMRADKEWAVATLPRLLMTSGRTSRRIFLRGLSCLAGKETSLAQTSTWLSFRSHLGSGRMVFFSHQKMDWLYSLIKGVLLVMDSTSRPEAEVLGAYRDSYAAVTIEEHGLRLISSFSSEVPTVATRTSPPAPEFLTFRQQIAGDFNTTASNGTTADGTPRATASDQGKLTACKSNLKNIGTACEMWSTDNAGRYPKSLKQLTPNYLRTIPTCPAAGKDTYSAHFKSSVKPDNFSVYCWGHNHASTSTPNNRPAYNAMQGLVEK